MHFNYHFLKFLCPALEKKLADRKVFTCFSQHKDELVIGFEKDDNHFYIRANLLPVISCLGFPQDFKRGKKNTVSLFSELIGQVVQSVKLISFERAFYVNFESGDTLLFKLHGTRSNVLFYKTDTYNPYLVFRNELHEDKELDYRELAKNLDLSFDKFEELEGNASKFLPTLGKTPRNWLKSKGYIEADLHTKWQLIKEVLDFLESPLFAITTEGDEYNLSLLPETNAVFTSEDPVAVCNELFKYKVVVRAFEKEKNTWLKRFEDQQKKTAAYISKTSDKLTEIENKTPPSQLADVLMANLHQIPKNAEEVTLFNFYSNTEETFRLKRGVSPQKLAENLYRKSKNSAKEINQLYANLEEKEKILEQTKIWKSQLETISDFRDLKSFLKDNNLASAQKEKEEVVPFKRFEIEGFEVIVGKSAKGNDEMLRYFAWKDDLWLHAKDVSGSHVLIKYRSGINFPKSVIERAAELAAYYSKNKNETLAPVMYTPAKYVRKIKGSPAGAVMVDRESVIMVPPIGPEEN